MIHVIPMEDSKPHIPLSTCECGPRYDPDYDMIVHEAFQDTGQKWLACRDGDFTFVKSEKDND